MVDPKKKAKLEELKRLRQEGSTHFHSVDLQEDLLNGGGELENDPRDGELSSDYGDAEDLRDFIEDAGPGRSQNGSRLPSKREPPINRPLANFFKKSTSATKKHEPSTEKNGGGDAYFQSLMQQLDDEEDSSSDEEAVQNNCGTVEPCSTAQEPKTDLDITNLPQSVVPPSEIFAPFDPKVINDEVLKQLEEEDWDMDDIVEAVNGIEKEDFEMEDIVEAVNGIDHAIKLQDENEPPVPIIGSVIPMEAERPSTWSHSVNYVPATDGYVDFYWLDAYEKNNTGLVYLFGKIKEGDNFVSCCVTVQNIQRNLFFLPRENVTDKDGNETEEEVTLGAVQAEIGEIMSKHKITRFGSKMVTRKYAFEVPEIPAEADWIKVVYGFNLPQLPNNLSGRTFSHVFGTNTSALELLLMKRKMMGPCWIRLKPSSSVKQNISWCKTELVISNPKTDMQVLLNGPDAPPLTILSLSLRTCLNKSQEHEIISASGLVFDSVSSDGNDSSKCSSMFTVVRDPEGVGFSAKFTDNLVKSSSGTKLDIAKNERALLSLLVAMIYRHDPDVLVGHNFLGFDLGVLLHRMKANKVDYWSRLGRLNWSQWPKAKAGSTEATYQERQIVSGRLVCDTWLGAKELVKAKNYSLANLVEQVLGEKRLGGAELDVFGDPNKIARLAQSSESLLKLLRQAEMDAYQQTMLMFRMMMLPLTKQLTNIAGNLWSRTLSGSRAERNEYLLLHEFHQAKYICPDKQYGGKQVHVLAHENDEEEGAGDDDGRKTTGRRKPAYAGGLVLEPKRGFYDKIVILLDFNSLYPSIIQEYNICFTTVVRDSSSDEMPDVPDAGEAPGVLPRVLKGLVEKRAAVKRLMKDSKTPASQLAQYNTRQQALKLTANSMYGCLGFAHSRFYAKPLAMLITARGRDILQSTVQLAQQQCHLDVVYGDTDSIMIHTGCTDVSQAKRLSQQVKKAVNEKYRLLEIELDGIFEKLLLLRKKKYAAMVVEEKTNPVTGKTELVRKLETKGLDMVRRDWCKLSVEACDHVLNQLMNTAVADQEALLAAIHGNLENLGTEVREGKLPLDLFIISKNLTKDPESYADAKSQPHVVVAQRMKTRGLSARAGDTIPYVICEGNGSGPLSERAFHPDEMRVNPALVIDAGWYLAQQVHPPVSRLCECIEGTDQARLAKCLGLDSRKYSATNTSGQQQTNEDGEACRLLSFLSDEERYKDVRKLDLVCPKCTSSFAFTGPLRLDANGAHVPGMQCTSCSLVVPPATLYCQILTLIRTSLTTYHLGWLKCDEPACAVQTRRMRVYESRCTNEGCRGSLRPMIPGSQVYAQLLYLRSLLDWDKAKASCQSDPEALHLLKRLVTEYEPVRAMVLHQLNQCAYPIINLREVFAFMKV